MSSDSDKLQIGIRLPADTVRKIDALRGNQSRAEFCRSLIERGLTDTDSASGEVLRNVNDSLDSMQEQLVKIHQSALLGQRDAGQAVALMERSYSTVATAFAGVLTKIGQAVREDDQRKFAREKAEQFMKRIFYPDTPNQEKEP